MPRAKETKLYRTFVKGLITEASQLTYPEDSSTGEMNTILSRKGNRTRRLGIDYEAGHQPVNVGISDEKYINEFVWFSVGNDSALNFLCIQVGGLIHFFSLEDAPVSDSKRPFTIDLNAYKITGATPENIDKNYASFSAGKGHLFITHPYAEPVSVTYDAATNTIKVVRVIIQVRDFEGVHDGLPNDEEPITLSPEHQYNLMNQGWAQPGPGAVEGGITPPDKPTYYDPDTGLPTRYDRDGNTPHEY